MRTLFKLSVTVQPETEETTVELLQELFQTPACVEMDMESNTTQVSVFLKNRPSRAKLRSFFVVGPVPSPGLGALPSFSIRKLRPENWAESWKRHFKPIEIGSGLLIKPSWSRRKAKRNQAVIVLDPGLSFGTGQHPTTHFCLEQIVVFRAARPAPRRRRAHPPGGPKTAVVPRRWHRLRDFGHCRGQTGICAGGGL